MHYVGDVGFSVNEVSKARDSALLERARTAWSLQNTLNKNEGSLKRKAEGGDEGCVLCCFVFAALAALVCIGQSGWKRQRPAKKGQGKGKTGHGNSSWGWNAGHKHKKWSGRSW